MEKFDYDAEKNAVNFQFTEEITFYIKNINIFITKNMSSNK